MRTAQKLVAREMDHMHRDPVTIAVLGDSVTQGCFECWYDEQKGFYGPTQPEECYASKLQRILHLFCPNAQLNIINAGVGGDSAAGGLTRFDRDVARFSPDLVVIAFALNDSAAGPEGISAYKEALKELIRKTKALGAECILLTPNAMNDYVSPYLKEAKLREAAELFMDSCLDDYVNAAREAAAEENVPLCDVYAKWQTLRNAGVDTTELLANRLNHPVRPMHWVPAWMLAETIFEK